MLNLVGPFARKAARLAALMAAAVLVVLVAARAYGALQGSPVRPWHTFVPEEMAVDALRSSNWASYLEVENEIFQSIQNQVVAKLDPDDRAPANRYFYGSPLYTPRFAQDWNRSFILEPEGEPVGAAVLLHGLTDSPYSVRHIAERYSARGFVAVAIRLPGHGTVPGGLTRAAWEDWLAATELAVREAALRGAGKPLHIVGYSNGGALALKYALDALRDPALDAPDRIILISPMIGVTEFARFAWLAALPAYFPAFVKAAWLDVLPEFNPFKYNSFPVNAAQESYRLTTAVHTSLEAALEEGRLGDLPPILTFQSAVDHTVSARAVVKAFYDKLPANGSELVLFDINRTENLGLLMASSADTALSSLLEPPPRSYRVSVITNAGAQDSAVMERVTAPGSTVDEVRPLGLQFPPGVFSLSHVALPFPPDDPLYGRRRAVDFKPEFGINLGGTALRGETGVLVVTLDTVLRQSYNPFFAYLLERIEETTAAASLKADRLRP